MFGLFALLMDGFSLLEGPYPTKGDSFKAGTRYPMRHEPHPVFLPIHYYCYSMVQLASGKYLQGENLYPVSY